MARYGAGGKPKVSALRIWRDTPRKLGTKGHTLLTTYKRTSHILSSTVSLVRCFY